MATEVKLINDNDEVLETLKLKTCCLQFLIYRGRLLELVDNEVNGVCYIERSYLEVY